MGFSAVRRRRRLGLGQSETSDSLLDRFVEVCRDERPRAASPGADFPGAAALLPTTAHIVSVGSSIASITAPAVQGEEVRFAVDSPLEGAGFEPSVPVYGELAADRVERWPIEQSTPTRTIHGYRGIGAE